MVSVLWHGSSNRKNEPVPFYDRKSKSRQQKPMQKPVIEFELPPELEAHLPPELRGLRRDQVRLLVLPRFEGDPIHTQFDAIGEYLRPGDLLVVNNSRTLPAMLPAH